MNDRDDAAGPRVVRAMRGQFAREMTSLDDVFEFLTRFSEAERVDPSASYVLNLAVEEFFTNMIKYGGEPAQNIVVEAMRAGKIVTVRVEGKTPEAFDVTRPTQTQFDMPAMERKPGGLGIHIAKEMLDGLRYDYVDGISRITLIKNLEK
jgi:anti-sigma regulatory factor (Ser/Thr protein kinase)